MKAESRTVEVLVPTPVVTVTLTLTTEEASQLRQIADQLASSNDTPELAQWGSEMRLALRDVSYSYTYSSFPTTEQTHLLVASYRSNRP